MCGSPWLQTQNCNSLLIPNKPVFTGEIPGRLFALGQQNNKKQDRHSPGSHGPIFGIKMLVPHPPKMRAHSHCPQGVGSGEATEAWGKEGGVFTSSIIYVYAI